MAASEQSIWDRREFLSMAGAVAAGTMLAGVWGNPSQAAEMTASPVTWGYDSVKNEYTLPPLDYGYDALEPSIDAQTMTLHHDKHHAGYVRGLNTAMGKLAEARAANDFALVKHWSREVSFNGGGHLLHTIFWKNLAPTGQGGGGEPPTDLAAALNRSFGSVEAFRAHFSAAANAVEGGGWAVLAQEPASRQLVVFQMEKQQNLFVAGSRPLLVLDVWEHAYYLKYQNRRNDYVAAFWDVVHWRDVAERWQQA